VSASILSAFLLKLKKPSFLEIFLALFAFISLSTLSKNVRAGSASTVTGIS